MQPVNMCEHSNHFGIFDCPGAGPACGKNEASQTRTGRGLSTPSNEQRLRPEKVENSRCWEETKNQRDGASAWPCADPIFITPSWFSAPPRLALLMGSLPDNWRNELRFLREDETSLVQDVVPTTAQRYDGPVAEFEKYESQRHPWARRAP